MPIEISTEGYSVDERELNSGSVLSADGGFDHVGDGDGWLSEVTEPTANCVPVIDLRSVQHCVIKRLADSVYPTIPVNSHSVPRIVQKGFS